MCALLSTCPPPRTHARPLLSVSQPGSCPPLSASPPPLLSILSIAQGCVSLRLHLAAARPVLCVRVHARTHDSLCVRVCVCVCICVCVCVSVCGL